MCEIAKKNAVLVLDRARKGQVKYHTDLLGNNGDRFYWLQHAKEEALDLANYIARMQEPIQTIGDSCGNCTGYVQTAFKYCPHCGAVLKF